MAPVTALPAELIHNILQADYLGADGEPDRRLLRASSLICNAWSSHAQHLLFSNVVLRSEHDFHSFRIALSSQPSLATAVRSLRVVIDHNQPCGLRLHHLAAVTVLCTRLNDINLALFGDDGFCSSAESYNENGTGARPDISTSTARHAGRVSLALAEALAKSPIRSFHLSNWSSNSLFLHDILQFLPSLKSLSITGTPPSVPNTLSVYPCNLSLNHLRVNFQASPSVDFLLWLLDNSKGTLTTLDLERVSDLDASIGLLDYFATTQGPALQSLILPSCANPTELKHFQRCTNLRVVAFRTPNVSSALFKHFLATADSTPLEEMYICVNRNTSLSPLIEFVRQKESLMSLTVCLWETHVRKSLRLWGSLRMACAVRGVELKVVESLSEYKTLIVSLISSFALEVSIIYLYFDRNLTSEPEILRLPASIAFHLSR